MGKIVAVVREKCCLGKKKPVLPLVNILCGFWGGCTAIARRGRGG
jgi:hypothetical protein